MLKTHNAGRDSGYQEYGIRMDMLLLKKLFSSWPIKALGLIIAIVAILLILETLAVVLNLPE
jgi:hypothetical protein